MNRLRPERRCSRVVVGALALAAVLVLVLAGCERAPRPVDVPVSSAPVDPRLGVHTRLTDEPDPEKIARTLLLVREMGAGSITEYFPWAYFEPRPGQWDWEHADLVFREAQRQGLQVYARVDLVPDWARPPESSSRLLADEHVPDYARAVATFAARYRESLAGVIVWNEPNVSFEWGFRPVSPEGYAHLLAETSSAVRAAAPGVRIVAAGLAPTLERSEWGLDDLEYLDRLYQAGAAGSFDALAAHSYGWQQPPEDPPAPDRINYRRVELLRDVMVRHGDSSTPIVLTEAGWNDHPRWTKAVRPAQRLQYTLEALEMADERWPWLEGTHFWLFRLPRPAHNYNDGFAFVASDFTPRPVYEAVQQYGQQRQATAARPTEPRGRAGPAG